MSIVITAVISVRVACVAWLVELVPCSAGDALLFFHKQFEFSLARRFSYSFRSLNKVFTSVSCSQAFFLWGLATVLTARYVEYSLYYTCVETGLGALMVLMLCASVYLAMGVTCVTSRSRGVGSAAEGVPLVKSSLELQGPGGMTPSLCAHCSCIH